MARPSGRRCVKHPHRRGLGDALGLRRVAVFVEGLEIAAVERDVVGIFAAEHGVRLGSGGDENGARRQHDLLARSLVRVGAVAADLGRLCRVSRSAAAWPKTSTSTSSGVRHSAKRMPSSIAFATSSWLSV